MSDQSYGVSVTRAGGVVTIVANDAMTSGQVFTSRLPVAGAELSTSARDPSLRLTARIENVDMAAWWAEFLYGPAVAGVMLGLADGQAVEAAATTTDLSDAAGRLLLGRWLQRWRPSSPTDRIEEWLVDAELGTLAWKTEELFGGVDLAISHFESADVLTQLSLATQGLADRGVSSVEEPLPATVAAAARAALDVVEPDHPVFDKLEAAYVAMRTTAGVSSKFDRLLDWISSSVVSVRDQLADATLARGPAYVAGSADGATVGVGHVLVDWRNVHPRSIGRGVSAANWELSDEGGSRILRVVATRGYATVRDYGDLLYARVTRDGVPLAAAVLEPDGAELAGAAIVPDDTRPQDIVVDLLSEKYGDPQRPPADAAVARRVEREVVAALEDREEDIRVGRVDGTPRSAFAFERTALELAASS